MYFHSTLFPIDEPILSFQRNAFLPLKDERNLLKKQDPNDSKNYRKAINLLYHEVIMFALSPLGGIKL